jgi:hypothetical protein
VRPTASARNTRIFLPPASSKFGLMAAPIERSSRGCRYFPDSKEGIGHPLFSIREVKS